MGENPLTDPLGQLNGDLREKSSRLTAERHRQGKYDATKPVVIREIPPD